MLPINDGEIVGWKHQTRTGRQLRLDVSQALKAAINRLTATMFITRVRLWASTHSVISCDLRETSHEEVPRTHAHLHRAEGMIDVAPGFSMPSRSLVLAALRKGLTQKKWTDDEGPRAHHRPALIC